MACRWTMNWTKSDGLFTNLISSWFMTHPSPVETDHKSKQLSSREQALCSKRTAQECMNALILKRLHKRTQNKWAAKAGCSLWLSSLSGFMFKGTTQWFLQLAGETESRGWKSLRIPLNCYFLLYLWTTRNCFKRLWKFLTINLCFKRLWNFLKINQSTFGS